MEMDIPSHQSQYHSERLMYSSSKPRDYLYRLISYVVNQCRLHLRPSNSQIPSWLLPSSLVRGPRSLSLIGRPGILRFLTIIIKGLGSSGKKNSYGYSGVDLIICILRQSTDMKDQAAVVWHNWCFSFCLFKIDNHHKISWTIRLMCVILKPKSIRDEIIWSLYAGLD